MPPRSSAPFCSGRAGEDVARLPRMNADAGGRFVEQAGDDVQLRLERRQRLEALAQLHLVAGALRPPVLRVDAAAHEQRGEPLGKRAAACRPAGVSAPDGNRFQPRQGHRHADAAEERAAGNRIAVRAVHGRSLMASVLRQVAVPRFVRNCGLVTMLSTRLPKR